ncbi:MAG: hypothetical protein ACOY0T_21805 [Myxococcota bacterium]
MTIRTIVVSLSAVVATLFAASACEIHNCEHGATCNEDDWEDDDHQHAECTSYCGRLSVCGAEQAGDFGKCVDSCRERYKRLPEETHRLCACAEASSCNDVIEGRCSQPQGSGGNCNSCGSGGNTNANGGAPVAGTNSGNGGTTNGGSNSGSGGATGGTNNGSGGNLGTPCNAACDCPVDYSCVSGYCVAN